MRSLIFCVSFALVSAFMAGPGCQTLHADIIVEVDSKSFTVGGSGTVDVWVYSNGGDVNVNNFGFDFAISSSVGNVGSLIFTDPQSTDEATTDDYIFDGTTTPDHEFGLESLAFLGGDFYVELTDFSVLGSDRKLLVQLDVQHTLPGGTDPTLALGDTFTIDPNFLDEFFEFYDDAGDLIPINETLSFGGTITMSAAAVPEPGTFAILLLGGVVWGGNRLRRKSRFPGPEST